MVTNPPLKPLRRVIVRAVMGVDLASVVLLLLIEFVYQTVLTSLLDQPLVVGVLLVRGVFHLLNLLLNVYLFSILIVVILSWISPVSRTRSASCSGASPGRCSARRAGCCRRSAASTCRRCW
ncbi:MAG: YggT family protein [Chromatiales bacterium]|nr:YggT family protein [Chromatiales bacterium]